MNALVVHESMYGNTQQIANAIAEGIADRAAVTVVRVDHLSDVMLDGIDLLVVGGPTQAWGMSRESTRKSAFENKGERQPEHTLVGVRERIGDLRPRDGLKVATFDTRFKKPIALTGSAAHKIAKKLKRHGFDLVAEPESFFVRGMEGPLLDGEIERARAWGVELARKIAEAQRAA
jgi:flavodoxin